MTKVDASAGTARNGATRVLRAGEVLDLVRKGRAETTSELAEIMGVARSTVTERVGLLASHGLLLAESPNAGNGQRGRPAARLVFNPRAGVTLAAQLGLTGARVAVTDLGGEVLTSTTVDVDLRKGPNAVLDYLAQQLEAMLDGLGHSISDAHGMGLGLPSRIELSGYPQGASAAPGGWDVQSVLEHLTTSLGVPVYVEHDVNILAFGEHRARWSEAETLIGVKAGTAIGCGVVVNGAVLKGAQYFAGEIGHTRVGVDETECVCGNRGCLNAVAGGGAIARRLAARGLDTPSARAVVELANQGDVAAAQAIREAGRNIGEVLAGVVNLLNPEIISVWGYLSDTGGQLFAGIQESLSRHALPGATPQLRIERAVLGDDAGIYGAAMMVVENALTPAAVDAYLLARSG